MTNAHAVGHQGYQSPPPPKKRKPKTLQASGNALLVAAALSTTALPAPSVATPNAPTTPISVRVQRVLQTSDPIQPVKREWAKDAKWKKSKKRDKLKIPSAELAKSLNNANSDWASSTAKAPYVPAIASAVHGNAKTRIGREARTLLRDAARVDEISNLYLKLSGAETGKVASYGEVLNSIHTLKDLNAVRAIVGPLVMERALSGKADIDSFETKMLVATFELKYYRGIPEQALSNFTWYAKNFPAAAKRIADYYFTGDRRMNGVADVDYEKEVQHAAKIVAIAEQYAPKIEPAVTPLTQVASSGTTAVTTVTAEPTPSIPPQPVVPQYVPPTVVASNTRTTSQVTTLQSSVPAPISAASQSVAQKSNAVGVVEAKKVTLRQFFESIPIKEIYTAEEIKDIIAIQDGRRIIDAMFAEKHPNETTFVHRLAIVLLVAAKNPNPLNSYKNPSLGTSWAIAHLALKLRTHTTSKKLLTDVVVLLLAHGGADAYELALELNKLIGGLNEKQVLVLTDALRTALDKDIQERFETIINAFREAYGEKSVKR